MYDQAIINGKVYLDKKWQYTNIYINQDEIAFISNDLLPAAKVMDVRGYEIMPGVIDPHVHFELDLGWIKSVDDFYFGSRAAVYGGVTSIVDFLEPVDNEVDLEKAFHARKVLAEKSMIDYSFHATIKNPKCDLESFVIKMKSLGMHTLKLFTTYSDSNRRTHDEAIIELLKLSKKHKFLILAHIENDDMIILNQTLTYQDLPKSRPTKAELTEALKLASFVEDTKGYLYMVHVSSGKTLEALVENFSHLINRHFFIESCPQYFTFSHQVLNQMDGYLYTCAPPLRPEDERRLLFRYQSYIQTIGTDHCAFMAKDKMRDKLKDIPLGIGGVEHALAVMRYHFGNEILPKMTEHVAHIQGLKRKGRIAEGYDADLIIIDPKFYFISDNHGKCDYSVYQGLDGFGKVVSTMIRGTLVLDQGQLNAHQGKWIEGGDIDVESHH
ncbi:MAG: amidohydrolase family protein [Acholeplasmataceae bacterium]|nr:amidohydrolase family protein [Acholeplasmataceae bacterium]